MLFDLHVPQYISRKIGHAAGGVGFLITLFAFSSAWWPIVLTLSFSLLLWIEDSPAGHFPGSRRQRTKPECNG
jgi:hypothetical protein